MLTSGDISDEDRRQVYAVVAARRLQWDNLVWQVPILSLTAQAFLFTIALAADSSRTARVIAGALAMIITVLCVTLMARHRQAELTDAHWLEAYESHLPERYQQHGQSWRARRDSESIDAGMIERLIPRWPGFRVWVIGLALFGLTGVVAVTTAIFWPTLLKGG